MKKTLLCIFIIAFFVNLSFADVSEDEAILLQERLLTNQNQDSSQLSPPSLDKLKALWDHYGSTRSLQSQDVRQKMALSTDPAVLDILKGTTWQFKYTVGSVYTDTLTFGSTVTTSSNGTVSLSVTDQYKNGVVAYDSEFGFSALIEGSIIDSFYSFEVNGNSAAGIYIFQSKSTGNNSEPYPMTGIKLSGPTPDPCYTRSDLDAKYDDGYQEGLKDGKAQGFTQAQLDQAVAAAIEEKNNIISTMFTQDQIDQAVAEANAAKDTIISTMFTKAQLDLAVAEANAAKDSVIAAKDNIISQLSDIDGDGKTELKDIIWGLKVLSGEK